MEWLKLPARRLTYVDTPQGIYTDALIWFRTREAWLEEYAGAVLEHRPIDKLLYDAAVWLRSPQVLALWLLPVLLIIVDPLRAGVATLVVYLAWQLLGPALVVRRLVPLFSILELTIIQALVYVGILSWLASADQFAAVGVGLAGFVLLRWGVLPLVLRPLTKILRRPLYRLPVPDHVLRTMIVRAALQYRVTLADFAPIEDQIVQHLQKRK